MNDNRRLMLDSGINIDEWTIVGYKRVRPNTDSVNFGRGIRVQQHTDTSYGLYDDIIAPKQVMLIMNGDFIAEAYMDLYIRPINSNNYTKRYYVNRYNDVSYRDPQLVWNITDNHRWYNDWYTDPTSDEMKREILIRALQGELSYCMIDFENNGLDVRYDYPDYNGNTKTEYITFHYSDFPTSATSLEFGILISQYDKTLTDKTGLIMLCYRA